MKYDYRIGLMNRIIIRMQKKIFKLMTDAIKDTSENLTKTILEKPIKKQQLMDDKGLTAPYLASSLIILFKPENKSQFRF